MITIAKLIEELQKYPQDALAYAYEGEFVGIVIVSGDRLRKRLGEIPASESDEFDSQQHSRMKR